MSEEGLNDLYRDVRVLASGREGAWHAATLADGLAVRVLVLAPELSAMVRSPADFLETLDRASRISHPALRVPRSWGQLPTGQLHVAFADDATEGLVAGGVPATEIASIGTACARGLAAVHATGLVDGAIQPTRLRRGAGGEVTLGDLGLLPALISGGAEPRAATLALSEPNYISPEVQNGAVPDEHSDIYSLGAVLYELLTGKPPYGGRTTAYVMASVLAEESDPEAAPETTSPVIDALVRAVERSPEDRWPSMGAFADALGAAPGRQATTAPGKSGCFTPVAAAAAALATLSALSGLWP